MELTEYQFLYIKTVYDYFLENLQWPTFRQVQKKILPTHRDFRALEVASSIEDNQALYFFHNLDSMATITLKEIHYLPEAEQDLADIVKVISYSVEKYIVEDKEGVRVTSEEISLNLQFDETAIRKVFQLLGLTSGIIGSNSNSLDYKTWYFDVSDSAIDFQNLKSVDDYFEWLDKRKKSYSTGNIAQNIDTIINQYYDPAPIIEKVAQTDPANIQATTANLMQIDNSYYLNALQQSQRSFFWALVGAGIGVAFFIAAVFILIFRQPIRESYVAAIITASSGGVVEIIAGIILTLHRRASDQVNSCHIRLNRMQRFLVANSACESLEGNLKQTTRAELMKNLAVIQAIDHK